MIRVWLPAKKARKEKEKAEREAAEAAAAAKLAEEQAAVRFRRPDGEKREKRGTSRTAPYSGRVCVSTMILMNVIRDRLPRACIYASIDQRSAYR